MKIKIKRNFKFSAGFKRFLISLPITICILFIFLNKVNADIPSVPSNLVSCTCVTSAGQTCVTTSSNGNSGLGMVASSTVSLLFIFVNNYNQNLYTSCINNIYTIADASSGRIENSSDYISHTYTANSQSATGFINVLNNPKITNPLILTINALSCIDYIYYCVVSPYSFGVYSTYTYGYQSKLSDANLGSNTDVPCLRSNSVLGTLHYTGSVDIKVQKMCIGFGGGDGGGFGDSGCSYSGGTDNYTLSYYNYSCY